MEGTKSPFLVWTDHKNLEYIRSAKRLKSRQARWSIFFTSFNFSLSLSLSYRPGSRNVKPVRGREETDTNPDTILPAPRLVAALTREVEEQVKATLEDHPGPSSCPHVRLLVPQGLRSEIVLQWAQGSRLTCHPGMQRTKEVLLRRFWWPTLEVDTTGFVNACQDSPLS